MPRSEDSDYMTTARRRFEAARTGWMDVRKQATEDMRAVNVRGGQWSKAAKDARDSAGRDVHRPAVERMVVALRALNLHAEEEL